jgi:hypothetical protein
MEEVRRRSLRRRRLLGQPLSLRQWDRMTLNDKIVFRKLAEPPERYRMMCDKADARDFVAERAGPGHAADLLLLTDHLEDLRGLRGPFVLKPTHMSGKIIFVADDRHLTEGELAEAATWQRHDWGRLTLEPGSEGLARRFLVEELLGSPSPPDYKILAFEGHEPVIEVDLIRWSDHRRLLVTPQWTPLGGWRAPQPDAVPAPPKSLDEILDVAARIVAGFGFLRVDCYDVGGRVIVGEVTPTPISGIARFFPRRLDRELGSRWAQRPDFALEVARP